MRGERRENRLEQNNPSERENTNSSKWKEADKEAERTFR